MTRATAYSRWDNAARAITAVTTLVRRRRSILGWDVSDLPIAVWYGAWGALWMALLAVDAEGRLVPTVPLILGALVWRTRRRVLRRTNAPVYARARGIGAAALDTAAGTLERLARSSAWAEVEQAYETLRPSGAPRITGAALAQWWRDQGLVWAQRMERMTPERALEAAYELDGARDALERAARDIIEETDPKETTPNTVAVAGAVPADPQGDPQDDGAVDAPMGADRARAGRTR